MMNTKSNNKALLNTRKDNLVGLALSPSQGETLYQNLIFKSNSRLKNNFDIALEVATKANA